MPRSALPEKLDVPGQRPSGSASDGAVHDPGACEAAPPGAVGLAAGRAVAAVRRGDGPGVVVAGPVGGEPSGAGAAASPRRVAAQGGAAEGRARAAAGAGPDEGVRITGPEDG